MLSHEKTPLVLEGRFRIRCLGPREHTPSRRPIASPRYRRSPSFPPMRQHVEVCTVSRQAMEPQRVRALSSLLPAGLRFLHDPIPAQVRLSLRIAFPDRCLPGPGRAYHVPHQEHTGKRGIFLSAGGSHRQRGSYSRENPPTRLPFGPSLEQQLMACSTSRRL